MEVSMYNILKKLISVPSVSGREGKLAETLAEMIAPFADECRIDPMGNLIACRRGSAGKDAKKLLLCAHMDEIGFIAAAVEDNGYIRLAPIGGIDWHAAAYSVVIFENGTRGVLVPDNSAKAEEYKADKFCVDIGAANRKEAEKKVKIGDCAILEPRLTKLMGRKISGRPLDDKLGCAILVDIARKLTSLRDDVYFVFSVQEEVGCRGAGPAAFGIAPDYALVFDVTGTGDALGSKPMAVKVGNGAAIKIKDSSVICHSEVVEKLEALATERKIAHQFEILTYGGTDTSSIQISGSGARAGALSIPTRYIHTGVETVDLRDAEACRDLALAFAETL